MCRKFCNPSRISLTIGNTYASFYDAFKEVSYCIFLQILYHLPHIGHICLKGIDNNLLVNDLEHLQQDHLSARSFMQRSSSPEGEKEIERDTIVSIRYLDTYLLALRRSNGQTALYSDCAASIFNDTLHTHTLSCTVG